MYLHRLPHLALVAVTALSLAACDSSSPDPDDDLAGTQRRLLVAEADAPTVRALDVATGSAVGQITLAGPVRAYFMTEETGRYAFVAPTNGPLQVIDGGVFAQGGRVVEQAPALHSFSVPGENLVHLTYADGMIAGFYDGTGEARFFDARQIAAGGTPSVTTIGSGIAHHGTAVAIGPDMALVTKPVDGETLPVGVTAHGLPSGALARAFEDCPRLHGSAHSSGGMVAFGCDDGVLVVQRQGSAVTATKVSNPAGLPDGARTGTLQGSGSLPYLVAHFSAGGENLGPAIYDRASGALKMMTLPGRTPWARGYVFTPGGREMLALGLDGTLHILDGSTRQVEHSVANVAGAMPADPIPRGTAYPAVVAGGVFAYVSDPAANTIREVRIATGEITQTWTLDFTPGVMTLVGTDEALEDAGLGA